MEGQVDKAVSNHLSKRWDLDARIEAGEAIVSLAAQPGWNLLETIVAEFEERGDASLERLRHDAAMSATVEKSVAYAQARGTQSGMAFHRDVVATVLASAERAKQELTRRQREADAEGSS